VSWKINIHPEVADWLRALETGEPESAALIRQAIIQLADEGPTAKRPLVDRVKGSRYHNMKELRPGSAGRSEVRILFAFDPERAAILLVAGDKAGQWQVWYRKAIRVADDRYAEHLESLETEGDND
jgi:hypothetical protein